MFNLENTGKTMASSVNIDYSTVVFLQGIDKSYPWVRTETQNIDFGNIAPGKTASREGAYELPLEPLTTWPNLILTSVKLKYQDDATGDTHSEKRGYSGILSGDKVVTPEMFEGPLPPISAFESMFPSENGKRKH